MTKEALKLALEALERCVATCFDPYAHEQAMSGSEHFVNQTITAIKEALANEALEKMAENARELGLDYEPPQRTWVGLDEDEFVYFCAYVNHEILSEIENVLRDKNESKN